MTDLTDPAHARPIERRRSQRFTVRTAAAAHSYPSWERAIGAARSFAAEHRVASSVTDDSSGTRFDVRPDGCASPSQS
jgi:hypothetical protein